jgi:hypothetical protein
MNLPPKLVSAYPKSRSLWFVGKPIIFWVNASDFDNDKLSYSWSLGGVFGKKVVDGSAVKMTFGSAGKKTVKVIVSDGEFSVERVWVVDVINQPSESKTTSYLISGAVVADQNIVSYVMGDENPAIKVEGETIETDKDYIIGGDAEKVGDEVSSSYIVGDNGITVVSEEPVDSAEFVIQ